MFSNDSNIYRTFLGLIKAVNNNSKKKLPDIFLKSWRITGLAYNNVADNWVNDNRV